MQAVQTLLDRVYREESGRLLAYLVTVVQDLDLAEDLLQEASTAALHTWPVKGIPLKPAAWLARTARNRAIDRFRRDARFAEKAAMAAALHEANHSEAEPDWFPDERLRLIFTCCHPALPLEAQVALTLKTIGGLSVAQVASAFVIPEVTAAQRIVRAKRKLKSEAVTYRTPELDELGGRLDAVLSVLYLIFNESYQTPPDNSVVDLATEAIRLTRILDKLLPESPEIIGLLALMLLHHARRTARFDQDGVLITLEEQDRSLWQHTQIEAGAVLVNRALRMGHVGPYQLQASIAALHAQSASAEETDWPQIVALYGLLARMQPSAVVELNRAAAIAMVDGADAGLELLAALSGSPQLKNYSLLPGARADLLRRAGRTPEALEAYRQALSIAGPRSERRYYENRITELSG